MSYLLSSSNCLAAVVLRDLPDTNAWLRHAIVQCMKDVLTRRASSSAAINNIATRDEFHPHLAKLIDLVIEPIMTNPTMTAEVKDEPQDGLMVKDDPEACSGVVQPPSGVTGLSVRTRDVHDDALDSHHRLLPVLKAGSNHDLRLSPSSSSLSLPPGFASSNGHHRRQTASPPAMETTASVHRPSFPDRHAMVNSNQQDFFSASSRAGANKTPSTATQEPASSLSLPPPPIPADTALIDSAGSPPIARKDAGASSGRGTAGASSGRGTTAYSDAMVAAHPLTFTGRSGHVCRADSCLFISCLPLAVTEGQLHAECSKCGAVESVYMWNSSTSTAALSSGGAAVALQPGEAYVVFNTTIPDAAVCYETLVQQYPFGGSRPLHIEFCSALPPLSSPLQQHCRGKSPSASPLMWLAGPDPIMAAAVEVLAKAGLEASRNAIKVAGLAPGFMFDYSERPELVSPVVECLSALQRGSIYPPIMAAVGKTIEAAGQAAAAAAAAAADNRVLHVGGTMSTLIPSS
ncbi:hypothetical protein CEUSTIGMA_g8874.t1 [Chlamydomonas eustigma]|uniref:Uncharacterized protein n=1 Tax=Chlamydomonas eustigma TaxID=1157962 RepID=A0A250XED2_9CHLO|nr:hypothetical protein CEUSTIGMA_g8874.t1 [Chlamydomonas eustigma]|eukprot:GAX81444.1 hypothetical protein CEUSTIGMA_g8874.t1 [Chlamydomonas eustigma]